MLYLYANVHSWCVIVLLTYFMKKSQFEEDRPVEDLLNYSDPYEYINRVERSQMPPLIITVAITGGGAGKERNPHLPEMPEEQARATYDAYKAGAASVHIHARDASGADTSSDPVIYREINRRVRDTLPGYHHRQYHRHLTLGAARESGPRAGGRTRDVLLELRSLSRQLCAKEEGTSPAGKAGGYPAG